MVSRRDAEDRRDQRVHDQVVAALGGTVVVTPSDSLSGAAAVGAARAAGRGTIGVGNSAAEAAEALSWRERAGGGRYSLLVMDASRLSSGAWDVIAGAMPVAGLVVVADRPDDVPGAILDAAEVVDGTDEPPVPAGP